MVGKRIITQQLALEGETFWARRKLPYNKVTLVSWKGERTSVSERVFRP